MKRQSAFVDFAPSIGRPTPLRHAVTAAYRRSEAECLAPLLEAATPDAGTRLAIRDLALDLTTTLRASHKGRGIEGLVQEYSLSSEEGVALMCLAEALLRIPDQATRDALISDEACRSCRQTGHSARGRVRDADDGRAVRPGTHDR
jgi:RHH-type proline utilization regulon transcriptional repressor/proline dehydrogenase/delta 1-pyrroline-5-carboxylate dehydrogenase